MNEGIEVRMRNRKEESYSMCEMGHAEKLRGEDSGRMNRLDDRGVILSSGLANCRIAKVSFPSATQAWAAVTLRPSPSSFWCKRTPEHCRAITQHHLSCYPLTLLMIPFCIGVSIFRGLSQGHVTSLFFNILKQNPNQQCVTSLVLFFTVGKMEKMMAGAVNSST